MRSSWVVALIAASSFGGLEIIACSSFSGQASPAATPDAGTFCDDVDAFFCWSFDRPPYLLGPLLTLMSDEDGGAGTTVLTDAALSPPYAANATSSAKKSGYEGVVLGKGFDAGANIRCDADVLVQSLTTKGLGVILMQGTDGQAQLVFEPGSDPSVVQTVVASIANASVPDASTAFTQIANTPFDQHTWVHVSIALHGDSVIATTTTPDLPTVSATIKRLAPQGLVEVFFGAGCEGDCQASIDNITCAAE
jgi:hypothetical protein